MLVPPSVYWELLFAALGLAVVLGALAALRWRTSGAFARALPVGGAVVLLGAAAWLLAYSTYVVIVTDGGSGPVASREIWLGASDHYRATIPDHGACDRAPTWVVNESSRELVLHELGAMPLASRIPAGATACTGGIAYLGPGEPPPVRPIAQTPPSSSRDGIEYETYAPGTPAPRFGRWLTW